MTPAAKARQAAYAKAYDDKKRAKLQRLHAICDAYDAAAADYREFPDQAITRIVLQVVEAALTDALKTVEHQHFTHKHGHYLLSPNTGALVVRVERETREFKPCSNVGETKWVAKGFRKAVRAW